MRPLGAASVLRHGFDLPFLSLSALVHIFLQWSQIYQAAIIIVWDWEVVPLVLIPMLRMDVVRGASPTADIRVCLQQSTSDQPRVRHAFITATTSS